MKKILFISITIVTFCFTGLVGKEALGASGEISVNSNKFILEENQTAEAIIIWTTEGLNEAQVWMHINGGEEILFSERVNGTQTTNQITAPNVYTFNLYTGADRSEVLDRVMITAKLKGQTYGKGGTNYHMYDVGTLYEDVIEDPDSIIESWYRPGNLKPVIGTLHLDTAGKIPAQLKAMRLHGQSEITLVLYYNNHDDNDPWNVNGVRGHTVDSTGGTLEPQHVENLQNLLDMIIENGFQRVIFRFATQGLTNPEWWGEKNWSQEQIEEKMQENWEFISSTRNLVKDSLAGSNIPVLFDLDGEAAGKNPEVNEEDPQYNLRYYEQHCKDILTRYMNAFGTDDTYGFSIIGHRQFVEEAIQWYNDIGFDPSLWALSVYSSDPNYDEYDQLADTAELMDIYGKVGTPILIQEMYFNDQRTAQKLQDAAYDFNLTFDAIHHWPLLRSDNEQYGKILSRDAEGYPDYNYYKDIVPIPPICGDSQCNNNETCSSCPTDCGVCPVICSEGTCPQGVTPIAVGTDDNDCTIWECPSSCDMDVKTCSDGTNVSRDPNNNCEFYSCPNAPPTGNLDTADSTRVAGWAYDADAGSSPINVHIYIDDVPTANIIANLNRPDIVSTVGGPNHGFDYTLPSLSAGTHIISVYAINYPEGDNPELVGSPKIINIAEPISGSIAVTYPNGGEVLGKGRVYNIEWETTGPKEYTRINGIDLLNLDGQIELSISASTSNDGSYSWNIPETINLKDYKIRIFGIYNVCPYSTGEGLLTCKTPEYSIEDTSDNYFGIVDTITPPPELICPTVECSDDDCPHGCEIDASGCLTGACNVSPHHTLIRAINKDKVYRVIDNKRFWIPTISAFNAQGLDWNDVEEVEESQVDQYIRAKLLRATGETKVYYITGSGLRRHIPSPQVFNSYNNKWEDVIEIDTNIVNSYEDNNLIRLEGGTRVYLLENNVKYWIKTADVFNSRGYDWNKISPVNEMELGTYGEGKGLE